MRQNSKIAELSTRHADVEFPTEGNGQFHTYKRLLNDWAEANGLPAFEYDPESRTFGATWESTVYVNDVLASPIKLDGVVVKPRPEDLPSIGSVDFHRHVTFDPAIPAFESKRIMAEHDLWTREVRASREVLTSLWRGKVMDRIRVRRMTTPDPSGPVGI